MEGSGKDITYVSQATGGIHLKNQHNQEIGKICEVLISDSIIARISGFFVISI
jgi:hypothetical protein